MTRRRLNSVENELDVEQSLSIETQDESAVDEVIEEKKSPKEKPKNLPNVIFLGEEDKRLLRKFNSHIVNKLGIGKTRSVKV
jgi:hypothetical protein